jgi:hypothetical protein
MRRIRRYFEISIRDRYVRLPHRRRPLRLLRLALGLVVGVEAARKDPAGMSNAAERPIDPLGEAAQAGYWACFFDQGRGTFTPWTPKGGMKIRVESHGKQILKQLQRAWGGTISRAREPHERQWGSRIMWAWTICGQPARAMVSRVLPHMKRRRRREIVEAWLRSYPAERPAEQLLAA